MLLIPFSKHHLITGMISRNSLVTLLILFISVTANASNLTMIQKVDYRTFWVNTVSKVDENVKINYSIAKEYSYQVPENDRLTSIKDSLLVEYQKNRTKTMLYQTVGGFLGATLISGGFLYLITDGFETLRNQETLGDGIGATFSVLYASLLYTFIRPLFIHSFGNTSELVGSYWGTFLAYHSMTYIFGGIFSIGSNYYKVMDKNILTILLVSVELTASYVAAKYHTKKIKLRKDYI